MDFNLLNEQYNMLRRKRDIIAEKIAGYPLGMLKVRNFQKDDCRYCSYYIEYESKDKRGRKKKKFITKDEQLVKQMAKKRYYQEMLELINQNINAFGRVGSIVDVGIDEVMERIPNEIREKLEFDRETIWRMPTDPQAAQMLMEWINQPYESNKKYPESLKHRTSTGELVRSKSEALIYEKLLANKIAFKYEAPIALGSKIVYPDFTIMRIDNKIFYWEHAGCCFREEYRNEFDWKLRKYEEQGIVLWDNLIVTFDDINGNIDVRDIESVIQNKLLI